MLGFSRLWRRFSRRSHGYTAQWVDGAIAAASGVGAGSSAASETAANLIGRALAIATVEGTDGWVRDALDPSTLYGIGRALVLRGSTLHRIETVGDRLELHPCEATWTVRGSASPSTWRYDYSVAGPSRTSTFRNTPGDGLVHCRVPGDPGRPWEGRAPIAVLERELVAAASGVWRRRLADPVSASRALIGPPGSKVTDAESLQDYLEETGLTGLRGPRDGSGPTLVVPGPKSVGDVAGEVRRAYELVDFKPELDPATAKVVESARRELLRVAGIPDGLLEGASAGAAREAFRQTLVGAIQPIAALVAIELRRKLDSPRLRLTFRKLAASDVVSKARALKSLTDSGIPLPAAAAIAGVEIPEGTELRSRGASRIAELAGNGDAGL